jgi:hypothetical protein
MRAKRVMSANLPRFKSEGNRYVDGFQPVYGVESDGGSRSGLVVVIF